MKCEICGRECNGYISLSSHVSHFHKIKSKDYYDQYLKKENEGVCYCGKHTNFGRMSNGYSVCCSLKCSNNLSSVKEKYIQTCKDKFGVENASRSQQIKEKKIQTSIKHYNTKHPLQSKEVQKIKMLTCLEKFGETTNLKCEEIKEKIKRIHLKNLGVDNPFKSKEIQEKIKQTNLEKFGVDNQSKLEKVKEKSRQTNMERYGVDNWSKSSQGRKCSRINFLKLIENQKLNDEPLCPRIGNMERICLNELQHHTPYKINRNDPSIGHIVGFFPDGHISELKLFIEFDERQHFIDDYKTYTQKDIDREFVLKSIPGYKVFRISEKNWKENKDAMLHDFSALINELVLISYL